MAWWGKILGGTFGFLFGGPLGALLGAAAGHGFDRGMAQDHGGGADHERTQAAFFTATFAVMGHLAKADGRVSEDEIALANAVMQDMALTTEQRRVARSLFQQGKQAGFDLDGVLDQLRRECHRRRTLLQMFLEIQLHAAYADGSLHPRESELLRHIAGRLGFPGHELARLEALVRAARAGARGGPGAPAQAGPSLADAYAMLGVEPGATDAEVKRAYRRLMSQHHPDKLVAKGLPEEMTRVATARTQEIKAAYEAIKAARGTR